MNPNQAKALERSIRLHYFVLFTLVLTAALISAGCQQQQQSTNGNVNSSGSGAQPTPTPNPKNDTKNLGETPIVVTGGSVELSFNHGLFTKSGGAYTAQKSFLNEGFIYDSNPGAAPLANPVDMKLPGDGNCTIRVRGKIQGNMTDLIVIKSDGNAKTVAIEFNETDYPRRRQTKSVLHFNRAHMIDEVWVEIPGGNTTKFDKNNGLPPNGKLTIELSGLTQ